MQGSLPKISIIMPVLNRADTIEKAIKSVISQNYPNYELIILDGGSTDATVETIKKYEKYIHYWHTQHDGSAAVAVNMGLGKASGDLIVQLMADDWYEANTLLRVGETFLAHPNTDMITCAGRIVFFDEITQSYQTKYDYTNKKRLQLTYKNICFDITAAICCRFITKSFYQRVGFFITFDHEGKHILTNDKEFLMRAIVHHAREVVIDHLGHTYLAHAGSYSFSNSHQIAMRHCQEHMQIAQTFMQKYALSYKNRLLLHYWYNDQSMRLMLYQLIDKKFSKALQTAREGFKKYHLFWVLSGVVTITRIVCKRTMRYAKSRLRFMYSLETS